MGVGERESRGEDAVLVFDIGTQLDRAEKRRFRLLPVGLRVGGSLGITGRFGRSVTDGDRFVKRVQRGFLTTAAQTFDEDRFFLELAPNFHDRRKQSLRFRSGLGGASLLRSLREFEVSLRQFQRDPLVTI